MSSRQPLFLVAFLCVLGASAPAGAQAVYGYADLHSHLMAEHSFGGGWFAGKLEGPMDVAVQRCDGNFPFKSHAATRFPVVSELLGDDTGWHEGKKRGYDRRQCQYFLGIKIPGTCPQTHFEQWPMWNAIAHQQMWQGWLQQAYQNGLRVMVVSVAESNFLCSNTAPSTRRYDCDEMASIKRQISAAQGFVSRNSGWVGIATTPAQARSLIQQGKLALVLAVEVTQLFPSGDYLAQLDELRSMGVRSVQVVHHADNRFGGAAPIKELIGAANKIETITFSEQTRINDIVCRNGSGSSGTCNGDTYLNERGLTAEGDALVRAMMDRGMLVDVAHLSRKGFVNVYQIAQQRGNYPLLYSHAHMWNTIDSSVDRHEKYIKQDEIQMITNTGGMVGLRTGPEPTVQYGSAVSNSCQGSARSFAQSLMYAVDNGLKVGFGADLNGFTSQLKPRYNFFGCYSDFNQINNAGGPNDLHKKGLAHVGLLPTLMSDLQAVGTPSYYLDHLNRSAENFLQMWERSASMATVQTGNWTGWLNRDGPSGSGDWEGLSDFVLAGQTCSSPVGIECQNTSGVNWTQTGEVYTCAPTVGGICNNANQSDGYCQDYRVRFLCPMSGTFSYSASNTNSAQQNTPTHNVLLNAGQTIQLGTCSVSGASGSGDTYLRLYGPGGTQVAVNDDSCGLLTYMSFTATQSGTYQIRAGCYSSNSCSGTVAYTIQ
ncbi:microsomal dipeptidase-like Zn-dependent dipeptidase [Archangium gephyra]|nr:membrane dipeptidase [Archangium gephyra]REG29840.1 microsomal dipeptidase-like Zn-dependent dipeptidase [Archangium gephyra]